MYDYQKERERLFTEEQQPLFLGIRDNVKRLLSVSGAFTLENAATLPNGIGAGSNWQMIACIDRLVELGEIVELPTTGANQHRVFVESYR